ncbi:uncharacterized protein BXIN_0522 [Babesia sp. Xinjiang]|uniref:uncharacterized protein n=1 Tax=Babesia sp. Xinjiang TaxID=462227 RepID=UPI000A25DF39|nr:uncharacterized protein BXIN_0522 [Babesia sp. Xinjiang]ORM41901.1 hypothetical protein BXIN_0522 [Babesia sp. Xinjiang]
MVGSTFAKWMAALLVVSSLLCGNVLCDDLNEVIPECHVEDPMPSDANLSGSTPEPVKKPSWWRRIFGGWRRCPSEEPEPVAVPCSGPTDVSPEEEGNKYYLEVGVDARNRLRSQHPWYLVMKFSRDDNDELPEELVKEVEKYIA